MASADDGVVGLELHGFVVTRALRSGGMGHVYEATHPLIGHRVAVKVLRPELSANEDVRARFLREARAMSAVKHRNIVEIHNFGELPSGSAYLMMELIEGETLSEIIAREAPMSPVRALQLCDEILCGLAAAHAVGVVHRDLKPGNIVLMKDSSGELVLKVLDFGLARQDQAPGEPISSDSFEGSREERASVIAGTPEYISPEQASGKPVDGKGDLYALGVMLFEMLTGHLPFESDSPWELLQLHRSAVPPLVSAHVPTIHPKLDALVDQLLGKDPGKRAESARAARAAVKKLEEAILAMPPIVTPLLGPVVRQVGAAAPVSLPMPRPQKFRLASRAAAVVLVLGGVSVLAWSFTSATADAGPPARAEPAALLDPPAEGDPAASPALGADELAESPPAEPPVGMGSPPADPAAQPSPTVAGTLAKVNPPVSRDDPAASPARAGTASRAAGAGDLAAGAVRTGAASRAAAGADAAGPTLAAVARPVRKPSPAQKNRRKITVARVATTPKVSCVVSKSWRDRLQQQLEQLEQLSIAAIPDTAHPSLVAKVKARARTLGAAIGSAESSTCAEVEAQVTAWQAALR